MALRTYSVQLDFWENASHWKMIDLGLLKIRVRSGILMGLSNVYEFLEAPWLDYCSPHRGLILQCIRNKSEGILGIHEGKCTTFFWNITKVPMRELICIGDNPLKAQRTLFDAKNTTSLLGNVRMFFVLLCLPIQDFTGCKSAKYTASKWCHNSLKIAIKCCF